MNRTIDSDRQLDLALQSLPRALPPHKDLWPKIAAGIKDRGSSWLRPGLIAAGIALLMLPLALVERRISPAVEPLSVSDGAKPEIIDALLELDRAHREILVWSRRAPTNGGLARMAGRIEAHRTELLLYRSQL